MKKIIVPGVVAGIIILLVGMLLNLIMHPIFPELKVQYENQSLFRAWQDPLMSVFFIYPIYLGVAFSWVWDKVKVKFKAAKWTKRAFDFALVYFLVVSVPGMIITYSSFQVSFLMIFSWLVLGLVNGLAMGLVFAKMNK